MPTNRNILIQILSLFLTVTIPVLMIIISVRLVMSPAFLLFEYTSFWFPVDTYGFTVEDRMEYGPLGIAYLVEDRSLAYLADQTLPADKCIPPPRTLDTCRMFNDRELRHMDDVQSVIRVMYRLGVIIGLLSALATTILVIVHPAKLRSIILNSILLVISVVIFVLLFAILSWDVFFTTFHNIFFQPGSWQFYYSDTLIRLYPERFWLDAALAIGALTLLFMSALLLIRRLIDVQAITDKR